MSNLDLRPYQQAAIERLRGEVRAGRRRILLVAPTGAGKTVIASEIVRSAVARGRRVLVLAHRREIIGQTIEKLRRFGIDAGIIQAGFPVSPMLPVQVASVATLHSRGIRRASMFMPQSAVVLVDEAHHVRADSYQEIVGVYKDALLLGLTATPCRGDGRGLGSAFDSLIEAASVASLVREGHLVPSRIYAPAASPDLGGVRVRHGDWAEGELAERMDRPQLVGDIVDHWQRLGEQRPTVVFATGITHSKHIRDAFVARGVVAEHLDGTTPADERGAILERLAAGKTQVVTNAMVLTEGWDFPALGCLVLARPTKSLGLYRQIVGRALRPAPGKADAIVLDHASASALHGFPEDPIAWTLEEDRKASNEEHERRGGARRCPECGAVIAARASSCACGWERPGRKPEPAAGDLVQARRPQPQASQLHGYAQLLFIARRRGYKNGWAEHAYRERFGASAAALGKPKPMRPTHELWLWADARARAFARDRGRRAVR